MYTRASLTDILARKSARVGQVGGQVGEDRRACPARGKLNGEVAVYTPTSSRRSSRGSRRRCRCRCRCPCRSRDHVTQHYFVSNLTTLSASPTTLLRISRNFHRPISFRTGRSIRFVAFICVLFFSHLLIGFFTCGESVDAALPYWRQNKPPGDKVVNEEEDVEFECHADGIPSPRVSWFINGMPIECTSCLLYTSPSPRDRQKSRMPSSA